jgi:hypothetical protein
MRESDLRHERLLSAQRFCQQNNLFRKEAIGACDILKIVKYPETKNPLTHTTKRAPFLLL